MSTTKLKLQYPPKTMGEELRDALPCGNGEVGALVCGNIANEQILINHSALWHGGHAMPLPDVSDTLPMVRQKLDSGDMRGANTLLCDTLTQRGYTAELSTPHPLVALCAHFEYQAAFRGYERTLDMQNGEVEVRYTVGNTAVRRRLAVSRDNGCVLWGVESSQPMDWSWQLKIPEAENEKVAKDTAGWRAATQRGSRGDLVLYEGQNDAGLYFGCVAGVVHHEGGAVCLRENQVYLTGVTRATIMVKTYVVSEHPKEAMEAAASFIGGEKGPYEQYFCCHRKLHRQLFCSSSLRLGNQQRDKSNEQLLLDSYGGEISPLLLNKLWNFGRYLLISGTREGGLPCPLFGLWHTGYRQYWSQNMANINLQMIYWQVFSSNLLPLYRTVIDYYYARMDVFRDNARRLFGCGGIYIPAGTTPYEACPNQIVPVIMNWTGAAGWLCQSFYQYYLQSGDTAYYNEKILPLMLETAAFYEDFICYDANGKVKLYPSVSPENSPRNFIKEGSQENMTHPMPTAINATMDIAILRELLTNLLAALPESPRAVGWRKILSALPDYSCNSDGAVKEWQDERLEDNYYHRHLSHLYPIFPGREKSHLSSETIAAFQKAVELRRIGSQTGWSFVFMACVYARLGLSSQAMESLNNMVRSCVQENFLTTHNDWRSMGMTLDLCRFAPIQLDANMGLVTAVNEMLFYSEGDYLQILPACPPELTCGKLCHFTYDGGELSMQWNLSRGTLELTVVPRKDGELTIELPTAFCPTVDKRVRRVSLQKGVPYTIRCGE